MEDHLDDELEIMSERASAQLTIEEDVFEQPLRALCRRPAVTVDVGATVADAVSLMRMKRIGALLVTRDAKLAGIVTERDLMMKTLAEGGALEKRPISEIMTAQPETLMPDDAIKHLMNRMHVGGYRHVPIVDDSGVPLHVISLRDVLGFMLDHFPKLVTNIPPRPSRGAPPWGG